MSSIADRLASASGLLVFHLDEGRVVLGPDELAERAQAAARLLSDRGISEGDRVGILGHNRPEWVVWAYGAWMAGAAVVPLQVPLRVRDRAAFVERVTAIRTAAGCELIVSEPALSFVLPDEVALPWDTAPARSRVRLANVTADDNAVIQFTSGSTAEPKGATITHRAALAQMRALTDDTVHADDIVLSWAPFYHDLGLFLSVVTGLLQGAEVHILPTERFARDPSAWLDLVSDVGATFTAAPQSAWAAALRAAERRGVRVDLRSLQIAWFAAEGIDPAFVDRLLDRADDLGLNPRAVGGTYGLAEAVLAVATAPRGAGIRIHTDRGLIGGRERLVSTGRPLRGFQVRVARDGVALPDQTVGEIQVLGESLMSGYLGRPRDDAFVDGWLRTGDLGYLYDGELYMTGREKDMLIVMGQNYYPEDFEWAAGRVEGVRPGRCVAFVDSARESVCLLVEPHGDASVNGLAKSVRAHVADALGGFQGDVVVVPPGTIEKTTSGKLRRGHMRSLFEQGRVDHLAATVAR